MKKYFLGLLDSDYFIFSEEEVVGGDWMADQNGIYKAPEIDGFIGFVKVIASTNKLEGLPLIDRTEVIRKLPMTSPNVIVWNIALSTVKAYKSSPEKPIVSWGYLKILNIKEC